MSMLRHNPFGRAIEEDMPLERRWAQQRMDEKREFERWPARCDVWLLDQEGLSVLRCETDNIGQGGLGATVPIGYGLAVGQRYEVRVRPNGGAGAGWVACHGTVIRTRLDTASSHDRLSFALRFDQPARLPGLVH